MTSLGLEREVKNEEVRARTVERFRERRIALPTIAQLAEPQRIPAALKQRLAAVDPDSAHPLNLFRVHWHNGADRRYFCDVPEHLVLTEELTGVRAPIYLAYGNRFPMIAAHKVLAAYGCLVPRLMSGQFDPENHRAVWPSTGNYCRGGVAISSILGCRGVAVLPEQMSEERFEWLASWTGDARDIIRTVGSESNVKEIYDKCAELEADERNVIFNQFCEFSNHLVHYACTGRALEEVFQHAKRTKPGLKLAAFVSATGSAGTLGAGDWLKDAYGSKTVAVEALECPTMLYNGFGEHNIQGIGDKHIPLIHNVTNTDVFHAVSDRSTDALNVLFNTELGQEFLIRERGVSPELVAELPNLGLSSICNLLASIALAKRLQLGPEDAIVTVATDGAALYETELVKGLEKHFDGRFDAGTASRVFDEHLAGVTDEHLLEAGERERDRIFNLGYFTWVEQQGIAIEDFERRRSQDYWVGLRELLPAWDALIEAFNSETGALEQT